MEPKLTILFIGKKSRTTRHQLLPIYLRVTIDGKRFEVATHRHIEPSGWAPNAGKVNGTSESAQETNMALDVIRKQKLTLAIPFASSKSRFWTSGVKSLRT